MDFTVLFCHVDDFIEKTMNISKNYRFMVGKSKREFPPRKSLFELMTIIVAYHNSGFNNLLRRSIFTSFLITKGTFQS
jgi:hypothetical protein